MSADDTANLLYLSLLGSVLIFWFLVQNRRSLGKVMQHAAIWALIFLGAIAVVGLWDDIRQTVAPRQAVFAEQGRIEIPLSSDGHYYATLNINGQPVRFMIDTGATGTVLSRDDATRVGISPDDMAFFSTAITANGTVRTAPVVLANVDFGPFSDQGVNAYVNDSEMRDSLLGMSYLNRFDRLEISNGRMVLER
jgi:aspartyl protease family protein